MKVLLYLGLALLVLKSSLLAARGESRPPSPPSLLPPADRREDRSALLLAREELALAFLAGEWSWACG